MFFFVELIRKNKLLSVFLVVAIILTIILLFSSTLNKKLTLVKTSHLSGETFSTSNSRQPILFYFSDEINPETVKISISPKTKFSYKTSSLGQSFLLEITPNPWWNYDEQYEITIDNSLMSKNGKRLEENASLSFSLLFPKEEDLPQQPGPPANAQY